MNGQYYSHYKPKNIYVQILLTFKTFKKVHAKINCTYKFYKGPTGPKPIISLKIMCIICQTTRTQSQRIINNKNNTRVNEFPLFIIIVIRVQFSTLLTHYRKKKQKKEGIQKR